MLSTSTTTEEILDELTARSTTEVVVAEATASTTIRYCHFLRYYQERSQYLLLHFMVE